MGKRGWVVGAILVWCCASAVQAEDEPLLARVEALLSEGIEPAATEEKLLALGEPGERALWQLYQRTTAARHVRLRALSALSWFQTPATAQGFAELVRMAAMTSNADPLHPARSAVVLRRALEGLRVLSEHVTVPLQAAELERALAHDDAHVRRAAASLLASLDGADPLLARQLTRESSRMVRSSVERAIQARAARRR